MENRNEMCKTKPKIKTRDEMKKRNIKKKSFYFLNEFS
jgi:hypothetical protein